MQDVDLEGGSSESGKTLAGLQCNIAYNISLSLHHLAPPFLAFDHLKSGVSWWHLLDDKWIEAAITQITAAAAIGLRLLVFFFLCVPVQGMSGPAQMVVSLGL